MNGKELRIKRKKLGLTQVEFAYEVKKTVSFGPSWQTIQNIELERFKPRDSTMYPIKKYFEMLECENAK